MEEVDSIIIRQLQEIGCSLDDKTSIKDLESNEVILCAAQCLAAIDPSDEQLVVGSNLNMANKYKIATHLADKCSQLGFKGDLGYQTFLYGAEGHIRKLFLFLVEKQPRDEERVPVASDLENQDIRVVLKKSNIPLTWLPQFLEDDDQDKEYWESQNLGSLMNAKSILGNKIAPPKRAYYDNFLRVPLNVGSLINWNSTQLNPSISKPVVIEKTVSELAVLDDSPVREDRLEEADASSASANELSYEDRLQLRIAQLESDLQTVLVELNDARTQETSGGELISSLEKTAKAEKDRLIEMRSRDKTLQDLKNEAHHQKEDLRAIADQWAEIEAELRQQLSELRQKKDDSSRQKSVAQSQLAEMKKNISSKLKESKEKEQFAEQLKVKMSEPLPPGRGSYTKRIFEIVNNVKKQNDETKKVLLETRSVQKEINNLQGKVHRAFTVADENIFRDAKSSEWNKSCYKLLASLHENCDQIMEGIDETGVIKREILKLEELLEKEQVKMASSNLKRIQADLKQLQLENQKLMNMNNALAKQQATTKE